MKPKNKFQQRVFELSKKLSPITKAQAKWSNHNCFDHIGRRTKKGVVSCLECGHSWTDKTTETHCICPNCHTKLIISDTTKRVFDDYQYLCIVTTCEEFQVLRFVYIDYRAKVGEKAQYFQSEVIQLWINSKGKHVTIAKLRPMFCFTDTWNFSSDLEVRPNKTFYNAIPTAIYPRQKLIHEIKRSGFTGDFHKLTPFTLFH
jgi:RNase P subunit RPR2